MGSPDIETALIKKATLVVERLLKIRPRSEYELYRKLSDNQFEDPIIHQVLDKYKDLKIINDVAFAEVWIQSRLKRPLGYKRIKLELTAKGIASEIIEQQISLAQLDYDETQTVLELAKHRAQKYQGLPKEKQKQRLLGFLQRRGFSHKTIYHALNHYDR